MYKAIITTVHTKPHPNADKIQLGDCRGFQVVVGKDTENGTLGIYFPTDGKLGKTFAEKNNLLRIKNADGTYSGGFFDDNLRVRTQTFRGEKSDGFWCPLSYLTNAGVSQKTVAALKDGDTIDILDNILICEKYYTPATMQTIVTNTKKKERPKLNFPEHLDTAQYRYYADAISEGSLIILTEKLHGTSHRVGNVRVDRALKWYEKLLARFISIKTEQYQIVHGTRRTILSDGKTGYYGNEQFRYTACQHFVDKIKPGEIIYGEIVGYVDKDKPIMHAHTTEKLGKDFVKQYGKQILYTYGTENGTCAFYVYRITQDNQELSWFAMCKRAKELNIPVVPLFSIFLHHTKPETDAEVNRYVSGVSTLDIRHIREGVTLRVENNAGVSFLKEKSFEFKVMEGIIKDADNYIDREEVA